MPCRGRTVRERPQFAGEQERGDCSLSGASDNLPAGADNRWAASREAVQTYWDERPQETTVPLLMAFLQARDGRELTPVRKVVVGSDTVFSPWTPDATGPASRQSQPQQDAIRAWYDFSQCVVVRSQP